MFGGAPTTRTVTQEAPPPVDPLDTLIATTRLHLARIEGGLVSLADDPRGVGLLSAVRSDRAAHLEALLAERVRGEGGTAAADPGAVPALDMPADTATVLVAVRTDAENAQVQFTDGVTATGRYRAAILGSIAACLATHRAILV